MPNQSQKLLLVGITFKLAQRIDSLSKQSCQSRIYNINCPALMKLAILTRVRVLSLLVCSVDLIPFIFFSILPG